MKRLFDILVAGLGLLLVTPVLAVVAVCVKLTSPGPVLFCQERMGCHFRPFTIYKFRTMVADAPRKGRPITSGDDPRITSVGRILRRIKLDELPQLVNVLIGDMSLVGPRPQLRRYVELFHKDYAYILRIRPGITDLASIKFRNESRLLGQAADPEKEYVCRVLPEKIRMAKFYVRRSSLGLDLSIIIQTCLKLAGDCAANIWKRNRSRYGLDDYNKASTTY